MFNTSKNKSSSLVLKPCKSVQEISEKWLFIKIGQIPDKYYQSRSQQILSIKVSIKNYKNQFFRSDFQPMLMYLFRVSFLITLNIYKAYFKGRHIREYKENTGKR